MKIAVPTRGGALSSHFGQCEQFTVFHVDDGQIRKTEVLKPPEHEPGSYPRFLGAQGVDTVIAGGMGGRAQGLFSEKGITVVSGAQGSDPAAIVESYIKRALKTGENPCDH